MGRELRQRKPVTYESLLTIEASNAADGEVKKTDQGSLLKFTRTGINNTFKSKSLRLASSKIRQYNRSKSSGRQDAGNKSQRCRYVLLVTLRYMT